MLKQLSYILILTFLLLSLSCKIFKQKGWADNFKYALDQEKYNGKGSGKGWASNFQSPFSRERFSKSDGWATNFGSHDNFSKHCKNKGWAIDFRSNLKSDRFNNSGSGFFVLSSPKYEALKFSDSFSSGSRKAKEGGFVFNDKNISYSLSLNQNPYPKHCTSGTCSKTFNIPNNWTIECGVQILNGASQLKLII